MGGGSQHPVTTKILYTVEIKKLFSTCFLFSDRGTGSTSNPYPDMKNTSSNQTSRDSFEDSSDGSGDGSDDFIYDEPSHVRPV